MSRLWTPNRPPLYMVPYGALVGACRPKGQQPAASSLLTDLVAYYKLEEASGTRVDATLRGNDLTDENTVGQAAGKVGNAASFVAANNEALTHATNADFQVADSDYTIAMWLNLAANDCLIASQWVAGPVEWILYRGNWAPLQQFGLSVRKVGGGDAQVVATTFGVPPDSTWLLLFAGHDAGANTIFIGVNNGALDTTAIPDGGLNPAAAPFQLGRYGAADLPFTGLIDEVGIWKRVLTAAERTALYNGGSGITHPFTGT